MTFREQNIYSSYLTPENDPMAKIPQSEKYQYPGRAKRIRALILLLILSTAMGPCSASAQVPETGVVINEILSSNDKMIAIDDVEVLNPEAILDEDGDASDWIELYNPTSSPVDLTSCSLSDDIELADRWVFPTGTLLNPGEYLLVFASGKDRRDPAKNLHANFKLSSSGDIVSLINRNGQLVEQVNTGEIYKRHSRGRSPNGVGEFFLFGRPTPRQANSSLPLAEPPEFKINGEIANGGFFSSPQTVTLSTRNLNAVIQYTLFKGINSQGRTIETSGVYSGPITIDRTTVIRARAALSGFAQSPDVAHTYFMNFDPKGMPVFSLTTDWVNLFDPKTGIYVTGINPLVPNFMQQLWERPVFVEFFDDDASRTLRIAQNAGLRISGSSSRELLPRTLALIGNSAYGGPNYFPYAMFPKETNDRYSNFLLRNSSQDGARLTINNSILTGTFLRARLLADVLYSMGVDFRDSRHAIVFLDGQFWGIADCQEKFTAGYVVDNYPELVDSDNVDLLKLMGGQLEPVMKRPDNQIVTKDFFGKGLLEYQHPSTSKQGLDDYLAFVNYMNTHNLNDPAQYAYVTQRLDIPQTINYYIAQIWSGDVDWPNNNIRMWRDGRTGTDGLKGKWHYIFSDTDFTFGVVIGNSSNRNTLELAYTNSMEFKALVQNSEFRNEFLSSMAVYLNTMMQPDRVLRLIDELKGEIEPTMQSHVDKWWIGRATKSDWLRNIDYLKQFISRRPEELYSYVMQRFGVGRVQLAFNATPSNGGQIITDHGQVRLENTAGTYFQNIPLKLTAMANPGFKFKGWSVDGNTLTAQKLTITPSVDKVIAAVFEADSAAGGSGLLINEIVSNGSPDWVELYNPSDFTLDVGGYGLSDDVRELSEWVFPQGTRIAAKGHLLIYASSEGLAPQGQLQTDFNISDGVEAVYLTDRRRNILSQVQSADLSGNQSYARITDGTLTWKVVASPTPNQANHEGILPPPLTIQLIPDKTLGIGQTLDIPILTTNPYGDTLTYAITSSPSSFTHYVLDGDVLRLAPIEGDVGTYTISVTVTDEHFQSASRALVLTVTAAQSQIPQIVINEAMGDNMGAVLDDLGNTTSDWIELKNTGNASVDIKGFKILDSYPSVSTWEFKQNHVIPAGGYLVLWTTSNPGTQNDLHTNFSLTKSGETLVIKDSSGTVLDSIATGAFTTNQSKGRDPDGIGAWGGLSDITPGANNIPAGGGALDGLVSAMALPNKTLEPSSGDVDGDGQISLQDSALAAAHTVGSLTLAEQQAKRAAVDNVPGVTASDVAWIFRKALKAINKFPIDP